MKINHDLRHKISVVEAQGKALIEQKVELEAGAQAQAQEIGALRQEVARARERLQGEPPAQDPEEEEAPALTPSPAEVSSPLASPTGPARPNQRCRTVSAGTRIKSDRFPPAC